MKKMLLFVGLFVSSLTFVVFAPTLLYDFVNPGDDIGIVHNPYFHPLTPGGVLHYVMRAYGNVWAPLKHLSHAADIAVWDFNPFGHHLTNVVLHSINATLVFWLGLNVIVAYKERVRGFVHATPAEATNSGVISGCVIAALLFGLHPLRVESVAWVSARPDLISAFFVLLTTIFYFTRAEAPQRLLGNRWLIVMTYALALLSGSAAVVLPFALIVLDLLLLKRTLRESIREELPLIIFAALRATIAFTVESGYSSNEIVGTRIPDPIRAVMFSLQRVVFPLHLSPRYQSSAEGVWMLAEVVLFMALTAFFFVKARSGRSYLLLAWSTYVILMAAVFFTQPAGDLLFFDRLTYLPSVGLCMLAGGGVEHMLRVGADRTFGPRTRSIILVFCFVCFGLLSWQSLQQMKIWRNAATLSSTISP